MTTQLRIIGAVRGASCQLWGIFIPVFSPFMTGDLAHLQLSDLQEKKLDLYAKRLTYRRKGLLYVECNGYFLY